MPFDRKCKVVEQKKLAEPDSKFNASWVVGWGRRYGPIWRSRTPSWVVGWGRRYGPIWRSRIPSWVVGWGRRYGPIWRSRTPSWVVGWGRRYGPIWRRAKGEGEAASAFTLVLDGVAHPPTYPRPRLSPFRYGAKFELKNCAEIAQKNVLWSSKS
jgi:hypothetical protein